MKWATTQHDVLKFIGIYKSITSLCESGVRNKNLSQKALDLCKIMYFVHQSCLCSLLDLIT